MSLAPLYLKRREERRLRAGHPWVYSNEVDTARSPLTGFAPGEPVQVRAHAGKSLGCAYVNPHSLICARMVSRRPDAPLDGAGIDARLGRALALRERLYDRPFYRLAYGESDELPGLVVDRFGDVLVAQIGTAGMECLRGEVVDALVARFAPRAVVLRNDAPNRALEGLPAYVETAHGTAPEWLEIEENGVRFRASPLHGQKTGWYFDHRASRRRLADYVAGRRVLDVFSYAGAWGVQAAAAGAQGVLCVDASEPALEQALANAALNGVAPRVAVRRGDAFEALRALRAEGERFDVVVLDPPAFIPRKKDVAAGEEAYTRLNRLAMGLLGEDGLLVSASCSWHLARRRLRELIAAAGRGRLLQILEQGHQAPDHPVHPAFPESDYLKAYFVRVAGEPSEPEPDASGDTQGRRIR